jgi:hypothetical protein
MTVHGFDAESSRGLFEREIEFKLLFCEPRAERLMQAVSQFIEFPDLPSRLFYLGFAIEDIVGENKSGVEVNHLR